MLQQKSIWSSNSWLKRQAVTVWSEHTFISEITIRYLQVSWNNGWEKRGRQHGCERGQGASAGSHLRLLVLFCFAHLICLHLPPPHCWVNSFAWGLTATVTAKWQKGFGTCHCCVQAASLQPGPSVTGLASLTCRPPVLQLPLSSLLLESFSLLTGLSQASHSVSLCP